MSDELKTALRAKLKAAGVRTANNASLETLQSMAAELDAKENAPPEKIDSPAPEAAASPDDGDNLDAPAPAPAPAPAAIAVVTAPQERYFKISIAPGDNNDYNPVFLHVNGRDFTLPREKDVIVPECVKEQLCTLREPRIVIEEGANGEMLQRNRSAPRFNVTFELYEGELHR
jgi:hypothetical protein